jgi:hypothetical protein
MFVAFSSRQQSISEVQIDARSLEGINTIFESARTGNSLSTTIDTPSINMEFSCESINGYTYSDYSVNGIRKKTDGMVVFAPSKLSGKGLITWTYAWDFPFRVMNFFYVSNERVRYYFVLKDSDLRSIYDLTFETFSDNFKSEFLETWDSSKIVDLNDDLTVVVLFANELSISDLDEIEATIENFEKDVKIIVVTPRSEFAPPRSNDALFGNIEFYDKDMNSEISSYMGLASMYGAIVSADKSYYECTMQKASERFKRLACIFLQKYESLKEKYDSDCRLIYVRSIDNLRTYFSSESNDIFCSQNANILTLSENNALTNLLSDGDYSNELDLYNSLYASNKASIGESCAPLY